MTDEELKKDDFRRSLLSDDEYWKNVCCDNKIELLYFF